MHTFDQTRRSPRESTVLPRRFARCLAFSALLWFTSCGRIGIDMLPVSLENVCVAGTCASDVDRCPTDPEKNAPGICGCGMSDTADADLDHTPDCDDLCPGAPDKLANGKCGCPAASDDGDGDGIANCRDLCPSDAAKHQPQVCGCGTPDQDSDRDGMPDCVDACPEDPRKVVAGSCGCGVVESVRDNDADGKLDCVDLCNGIDDARYVADRSCGVGYCSEHNTPSSCAMAVETACVPGTPRTSTDTTCDAVDDDCDGTADEDFPSASTSCGVGACATAGAIVCVAGVQRDTCTPHAPAPNDVTCGGDDDCDGALDEDFVPHASSCGTGVCTAAGILTCASGVASDSCVPGAPIATTDANCNGIDEDCSGTADEDYPQAPSSCGSGACATTGVIMCSRGQVVDTCTPGTMAASDATCNGVDDDCNGTRDEDFVPMASACGVGACRATGTVSCTGGKTADSCRPGTPAAKDTVCNGIDDDCDGSIDEDYTPVASSCGQGVCKAAGTVTCVAGAPSDSCRVGTPTSTHDGPPANLLDDDCDGLVDEDSCIAAPTVFGPGAYPTVMVPAGCTTATVQLWGGGGGSGGQTSVGTTGTPGDGGSGGFAQQKVSLTGSPVSLFVGNGGTGCGAGGVNPGAAMYNGGAGADLGGNGTPGGDGVVTGGGAGASVGSGNGARGYYGGGGGGSGTLTPWPPYPGMGGGGGAASVLSIGGARTVTAGGGGGGGGSNGSSVASVGGAGGEGCSGAGGGANAGGGGGGGVCIATTTAKGVDGTPANAGLLPAGRAAGGVGACSDGGGGHAIVTWTY
ncbi:MAG: putative lipoprotein [Myxococcaceae bacterium]|nr:putative lipoprotein [Myxococcaceae bacterium]